MIDSKDLGTVESFDIRADLFYDDMVTIDSIDETSHSPEEIKAAEAGDWTMVVMKVSASKQGIELGAAYLGGCHYGWFPGVRDFVSPLNETDYIEDLTAEAVNKAKDTIAKLTAA